MLYRAGRRFHPVLVDAVAPVDVDTSDDYERALQERRG